MENTDFVIEHIDKEVKVITDRPSSVVNYPANTDFFIENIDDNVISIAHSLNIEASEVEFRPANTDFFIENIDNNVIMIAESLELLPSEVTIRPANTDFFVENIDKNLIAIAEYYELEPSRVVLRPANTDMFIENIDRNVTLIKSHTNVVTKSGSFINVDVPDGGTMQLTAIDGNATQDGTPTPDAPQPISTVTGEQTVKIEGKNLINNSDLSYIYSNVPSANNTLVTISTGIRYSTTHPSGSPLVVFKLLDATPYVGKIVRMSANFGTGGSIVMLAVNSDGTSTAVLATGTTSGATISHTITSGDLSGHQYIAYALRLTVAQGTTADFTNLIMTIDNADMSFEPYQGQEFEVNLGKNLADPNNANIINAYIRLAGITAEASNRLVYYRVEQDSYYTISATRVSASGKESVADNMQVALCSDVPANGVATYDVQQSAALYDTTLHASFTVYTGSHTYLAFKYANVTNTDASATLATIQLERGNKETPFSPYFAPIGLAKIPGTDYRDKILHDTATSKWYIEKQIGKVVLDGANSYAWGVANSGTPNYIYYWQTIQNALVTQNGLISNYGVWGSLGGSDTNQGMQIVNNGLLRVRYGAEMPIADWKAKVTATPMILYYALATPTTTEITDETLLAQLNFVADMYEGINNISFIGTGAQGTIEVVINKD